MVLMNGKQGEQASPDGEDEVPQAESPLEKAAKRFKELKADERDLLEYAKRNQHALEDLMRINNQSLTIGLIQANNEIKVKIKLTSIIGGDENPILEVDIK